MQWTLEEKKKKKKKRGVKKKKKKKKKKIKFEIVPFGNLGVFHTSHGNAR